MGQGSSLNVRGRNRGRSAASSSSSSSGSGGGRSPVDYNLPPLRFHAVHGDNITLSPEKNVARRAESFCKGIVFSDRPVMVSERITVRLSGLSDRWNGVLRVGFCANDPNTMMRPLPKYACPDLTSKPGFWAKALSERCVREDSLIHYYVSGSGDVHFGINGSDLGVFFSGVDTRTPLWAMIDLYGNCTSIEFVDVRRNLNNARNEAVHVAAPSLPTMPPPQQQQSPSAPAPPLETNVGGALRRNQSSSSSAAAAAAFPVPNGGGGGVQFAFHPGVGKNAQVVDAVTARRVPEEFAQGYAFTRSRVRIGERIVVRVLETEPSYIGSLAFGLTNCDPSTIDVRDLPEDSDLLLDRPEYWVVSKDVANCPEVADELSFKVNFDGSVEFSKNGNIPSVFMHVDTSIPLWAFWDIFGNTTKIRLTGSAPHASEASSRNKTSTASLPVRLEPTGGHAQDEQQPHNGLNVSFGSEGPSECTVCYEKPIDCVLYSCGHMCMCYECAFQQWRGRGAGFCPICRSVIRDVIKTFRS